jgi:hypothetical protein
MSDSIGLAELLNEVKRELTQSDSGQTPKLLMVEEVELQIQIGISRQGSAGLKVYVVELGGNLKRDDTHTVKVKLQPLLTHQERIDELKHDPDWSQYVKDTVKHTVKGSGAETASGSQRYR